MAVVLQGPAGDLDRIVVTMNGETCIFAEGHGTVVILSGDGRILRDAHARLAPRKMSYLDGANSNRDVDLDVTTESAEADTELHDSNVR